MDWTPLALGLCVLSALLGAVQPIYNLYFHPLRYFPGPRLAVVTRWYRIYYDVILKGAWLPHLELLHAKYGAIVRIGPNELHFSSPCAYATIYANGSPFTKESTLYRSFGMEEGSFAIVDPHKSRKRREMLLPLFSRRAILKLESVIQEKVNLMISGIIAHGSNPVDLSLAFRCTTFDTIADYCFGQSFNALGAPNFQHPLLIKMQSSIQYFWILRHFPFILPLAAAIPRCIAERCSPLYREFDVVREQVEAVVDRFFMMNNSDGFNLDRAMDAERETVFHHLIRPKSESTCASKGSGTPSRKALLDEALVLLQAGSDTVGHTCILGTFHALSDGEVLAKLVGELKEAWPDKDTHVGYAMLEKLPYLTAFIKESLRVSHGVITPLARVVPEATCIAGLNIPAGTIVSTGSTFMHNDPNVFSDPMRFNPDRWLKSEDGNIRELESQFVPFSRGPRMCLGFNLAWCEMYLIFANLFRKLDLNLYQTTKEDFKFKEVFVPVRLGRHLRAVGSERTS
ncbi:hypothetical protein Hypma_007214 [Hypsizygus marmoreus]|uniref:Trichodiene oxygenase n=1 Tax=Hypsizygus marmoreus TaxID=39966 RepID=A0A369K7F5_HYPMA|nr:hypothetical protein Hypma_007214 [Hypsizygus marmoreus]